MKSIDNGLGGIWTARSVCLVLGAVMALHWGLCYAQERQVDRDAGLCNLDQIEEIFDTNLERDVGFQMLYKSITSGKCGFSEDSEDEIGGRILRILNEYFDRPSDNEDMFRDCLIELLNAQTLKAITEYDWNMNPRRVMNDVVTQWKRPERVEVVLKSQRVSLGKSIRVDVIVKNSPAYGSAVLLDTRGSIDVVPEEPLGCSVDQPDVGTCSTSGRRLTFEAEGIGSATITVEVAGKTATKTVVVEEAPSEGETPAETPGISSESRREAEHPVGYGEHERKAHGPAPSKRWAVLGTASTVVATGVYVVCHVRALDNEEAAAGCDCWKGSGGGDCDDYCYWWWGERIAGGTAIVAGVVTVYLWYDYIRDMRQYRRESQATNSGGVGLGLRPGFKGVVLTYRF
jgi:hypothetical protein